MIVPEAVEVGVSTVAAVDRNRLGLATATAAVADSQVATKMDMAARLQREEELRHQRPISTQEAYVD